MICINDTSLSDNNMTIYIYIYENKPFFPCSFERAEKKLKKKFTLFSKKMISTAEC